MCSVLDNLYRKGKFFYEILVVCLKWKHLSENVTAFIGIMTPQQKGLLTQKWQLIIENVRAEDIIDYLIEVGVQTKRK